MTISDEEHVARWMISKSLATGHGDTVEDMLNEAKWQIEEAMRAKLKMATDFLEDTQDSLRIRGWGKELDELFASLKGSPAPSPAEAMRAKTIDECEEIAREMMRDCKYDAFTGGDVAACEGIVNRIAALKGKP